MENPAKRLPYLEGGVPGALAVFLVGEAVVACASTLVTVVSLFAAGRGVAFIGGLLAIAISAFGLWLSVMVARGALRLRKQQPEGAELIRRSWNIRRVLLVIVLVLAGIGILITIFSSQRGGFTAGLLSAAIYAAMILPMLFYARDIISRMETVAQELSSGQPDACLPENRLSGLAIFWSAALGLLSLVARFFPQSLGSYNRLLYEYNSVIPLALYLIAAHYGLVAACHRGMKRAHAGLSEGGDFAPVKASAVTVLGIIGGIGFIYLALGDAYAVIRNLQFRMPAIIIAQALCFAAAEIPLGIAMMRGAKKPLTPLGAALLSVVTLILLCRTNFGAASQTANGLLNVVENGSWFLASAALLAVSLLGGGHRSAPMALRIAGIVFAAVFGVCLLFSWDILHMGSLPAILSGIIACLIDPLVLIAALLTAGRADVPNGDASPEYPSPDRPLDDQAFAT